ncbi:hypothetical protein TRIP_B80036 [uncultured Desulfatiglans sp.]|uniref:Uncharacterized protein n=1 Tax=Uncultured Desulfatiglans sp. TaxID=1748965 RepID=A0A653AKI0_UNCDX|nr:hypothetical protein TRIP_B80036 [uncultured Desulfatiglans sp.]
MPGQHTEYAFETAIEHHLTTAGAYEKGERDSFDTERGLFVGDVIAFIQKTQPKEWDYLANLQKEKAEETLTQVCHFFYQKLIFQHVSRFYGHYSFYGRYFSRHGGLL